MSGSANGKSDRVVAGERLIWGGMPALDGSHRMGA
jgi:hypothetical protein